MSKTTIVTQSGALRAYSEEGVLTQTHIEEYLLIRSNGGSKTININNENNEYLLSRVYAVGTVGNFSIEYNGIQILRVFGEDRISESPNILIATNAVLQVTDDSEDKRLVIQLKRIGLERIIDV